MRDTIDMAREVFNVTKDSRGRETFSGDSFGIEAFAELVRADAIADEREACAEKTGEFAQKWWSIHCDSNKHMETTRKALKLALEALEGADMIDCDMQEAITAIKQALAAPVQEPVAWGVFEGGNLHDMFFTKDEADNMAHLKGSHAEVKPLTTSPIQPAPAQVSPLEFVTMVMEKEHLVGKPLFWAEWPNKEKST